jgi:hypothetical protein
MSQVATSENEIIQFGLSEEERERLKLHYVKEPANDQQ